MRMYNDGLLNNSFMFSSYFSLLLLFFVWDNRYSISINHITINQSEVKIKESPLPTSFVKLSTNGITVSWVISGKCRDI